MERVVLYDLDDVIKNMKGLKFTKNSNNLELVALWPIDNERVRILDNSLLTEYAGLANGFNRSRNFIRKLGKELAPNSYCDYYYQIKNVPETAPLREKLADSQLIVNAEKDEVGYIGYVEGKVKDGTKEYFPHDIQTPKETSIPTHDIHIFYEYDPKYEKPSYGNIFELIKVADDANGTPIWKREDKIIQNESSEEYAERALNKGVRTMVDVPSDKYEEVKREVSRVGRQKYLREFVTLPEMGNDYYLENNTLKLQGNIDKQL